MNTVKAPFYQLSSNLDLTEPKPGCQVKSEQVSVYAHSVLCSMLYNIYEYEILMHLHSAFTEGYQNR